MKRAEGKMQRERDRKGNGWKDAEVERWRERGQEAWDEYEKADRTGE